jgi:outer membrane protein assembly factor BamB
MDVNELLFLGTHGHVAALQKSTGNLVWKTSLPSTGYSVVALIVEDGRLFCASGGRAFALDPLTGEILWTNDLPGLGSGFVFATTAASSGTEKVMSLLAAAAQAQAAAAAANTH